MRRLGGLAVLLGLFGAGLCSAQYTYDYSKKHVDADSTRWNTNGSPTYSSHGATFSAASPGGSLISIPTISVESGGSQNDYEVYTTLALNSGGGTYIEFLRASADTVEVGSGSYVDVEVVIPSTFSGSAAATMNIKQCTSGTVTQLGTTTITATNGMIWRSVIFGTNLWIFVNNEQVWAGTVPSTAGNPGIGGYNMPSGSGINAVELGHHDTVAPFQINANPIPTSLFPNSASLQWQGVVDDANGIGLFEYYVARNGTAIATTPQPEFADSTVQPGTTYTYTLQAVDYHGNVNAGTSVTITTPPAGAVDPRRTGLYSTGSYWGGGGEQIDTLSGNLHFSVPLLTAQGRTGSTMPVSMIYDSQNWRQDNGVNWELGADVGFGFGWKMLIGSVTPYYTGFYSGADHYVFTDGTGAEYRLNQNNSGIWTDTTQSVYVWLDTTVSPNVLHFKDGSFWVLGSTSGGTEQDAGTMYPTTSEDTWGNQTIITYDTGAGLPYVAGSVYENNTSARILEIADVRAVTCTCTGGVTSATYTFLYDHTDYVIPHMTSFGNYVGTPEFSGTLTYTSATQEPPFGTDPNYGGAVELLATLPLGPLQPYQFAYDTAGAGELQSAIFPYGGEISWNYDSFQYVGSRTLREVGGRYLAPDALHATSPMWSYGISRPDAANTVTVHSAMTLTDASGIGAKTWTFNTSGPAAWQIGLASQYTQLASVGGAILQDSYYTWSQDPGGHPYISSKTSILNEGTGNQQSALSAQTLDQYGNVTQSVIYPYNNTTTPLQTYNNTYITSSNYTSSYIYNLLSTSTVTAGGTNTTLVTNSYDGNVTYAPAPAAEFDASSPVPASYKGGLTYSVTNTRTVSTSYYPYGAVASVSATDGTTATASASSATNYAAPQSISAQNYTQTVSYNAFLGITSTTGENGEQLSMTYDSYGRPATGTSPYGAVTTYTYGTSAPYTQKEHGPSGTTITTLDGFGRAVLVQRGDSSTPDSTTSYTTTVYTPCACSPLGKQSQASMPYPTGSSASAWTTWTYDGLGRTLSVQKPDGASTTTSVYSGNQTTVTDPAGNWKQYTKDVLGNLTTVVEPDPNNQPGGTLTTSYTYNWMNQVTQVSMPRGSTTQTRTFVYDTGGRLTSATNPENGTVTYTYNSTNTLNKKVDARGGATVYTYDSLNRVLEIQRYPGGTTAYEDVCSRVTYTYDTNPVNSSFSQNSLGRLTTAQYYGRNANTSAYSTTYGSGCSSSQSYDPYYDTYTEMYSYHPAGAVTAKNVGLTRITSYYDGVAITASTSVEADYTQNSAGQTATVTYPMVFKNQASPAAQPVLTMGYDGMGRPSTLTDLYGDLTNAPTNWVSGVQYDYAGRLTSLTNFLASSGGGASERRTYNVNGQLASIGWPSARAGYPGIQYVYSPTQNNGQITQEIDTYSGGSDVGTINYQYDQLKRLTSSALTQTVGSYPPAYTETFQYDGFGNLTAKVMNGTTTTIAVNATTNQLTSAYYDANGNMTSGAGATFTYDEMNRVSTVAETSGGEEYYGYDASNKRIYVRDTGANEWFTFYGADGKKLGKYQICLSNCGNAFGFSASTTSVWFGGRLIMDSGSISPGFMYQDRLGSNRTYGSYSPYGEGPAGNDGIEFATYLRDSYTGFDYADQRFYASTYGRFNTPDPNASSGKAVAPGSWNRYAYVAGDPVNRNDRRGTDCSDLFADASLPYDPYSPCSGGDPDNSCPSAAMAMALFQDDPDDATFEAQAAAMGCMSSNSEPVYQPPQPQCSISEYERPVGGAFEHTYLDISDPLLGISDILEGGPTRHPKFPNPFGGNWGNLNGLISGTFAANAPNNKPLSGDNPATNDNVATLTGGAAVCFDVLELIANVTAYDNGPQAPYLPWPRGSYRNSNSFTYTLLDSIGEANPNWVPSGNAPGWGLIVPGLGVPVP